MFPYIYYRKGPLFSYLQNMPPNVILAAPSATSSSLVTPALKKDEDQVFTWNEVYHYVCK